VHEHFGAIPFPNTFEISVKTSSLWMETCVLFEYLVKKRKLPLGKYFIKITQQSFTSILSFLPFDSHGAQLCVGPGVGT
jgi:hypothetical protein